MRCAVVIGSIQKDNGSSRTAAALVEAAQRLSASDLPIQATTIGLHDFDQLFTGEYIYFDNANVEQRSVLDQLASADAVLFVVPTYFKALPGVLKNFFDIVRQKELYEHKAIGVVASNHKNQDFGARQAQLVVQGILEFFDTQAAIVPDIPIINPAAIDRAEAERAMRELAMLHGAYRP